MEETTTQEVVVDENSNNILNSVNDEYLRKKKRTKNIIYSSILGILFILTTMIIVFASITVYLKPAFLDNPTSYTIKVTGKNESYIDETTPEYEEFMKAYESSFKVSYLSALFTGKLGGYDIVEKTDRFYTNDTNKTIAFDDLGDNYVKLSFATEQQIKTADGKVYYSVWNTNEYDIKFEDVYFNINSENEDSDLTFYFATKGIGLDYYNITQITVRANTYAIYEFATGGSN